MTYKELEDYIKENGSTVLKIGTTWCGPCQQVDKILDEIKQDENVKVNILKVDAEEDIDITKHFKVRSVPTIVFMDKDGMQDKTVGLVSKETILEKIAKI